MQMVLAEAQADDNTAKIDTTDKVVCDTSIIQDVSSHTRSKQTLCHSHDSSYVHRCFLHPQFKMQVKVSTSTLQDAPKDINSGDGPKCRLPQWLGANCEAFITTTTTIISGYTVY